MKKHRVLFDLAPTLYGYSGIPQDTRMLFFSLCQASHVDLTGLVSGISSRVALCALDNPTGDSIKAVENFAYFIAALKKERVPIASRYKIFRLLKQLHIQLRLILSYLKKNYALYPYHQQFLDFLWKTGFAGAVPSEYHAVFLNQQFVASNFSKHFLKASMIGPFPTPILDTTGYDFVVFQDGIPGCPKVSAETTPIIRYYDAVPLVCADTIANPEIGPTLHAAGIRAGKNLNAYFACDSYPSEVELLKIAPELEGRTFVVPVGVFSSYDSKKNVVEAHTLMNIVTERASKPSLVKGKINHYLISVSTLEPRKNYITLIKAFEKIRITQDPALKLIIVGSPGWQCQDVLEAMQPLIEAGHLLHLEKVPTWELNVLYSHARALISPSYYEGFGMPPLEASLVGCPAIISDIPVHRWVMGEGALYCNPYDPFSVSDAIEQLLYSSNRAELTKTLKEKARINSERFTQAAISESWAQAFDRLARLKQNRIACGKETDLATF